MQLVLAIEPDLRQATIVKRIVREKVLADVAVVDSRDAALDAMRETMPDVLLLSALMSPRDEDELIAHLRTLENADHLQTHTIPQLASALGPGEGRASGGLLSAFLRKKKKKEPESAPSGCDPDIFAEEIRSYLLRAAEMKRERLDGQARPAPEEQSWRTAPAPRATASVAEPDRVEQDETSSSSSWASPFEWKPTSNPPSLIANPESLIADPESPIAHSESLVANPESPIAHAEARAAYPEEPPQLMAHLRPPSGITTLEALRESLAAESVPVTVPAEASREEIELVHIEAAIPDPEPVLEAAPVREPEPIRTPELIQEAASIQEWVAIEETAPIQESAPIQETAPVQATAPSHAPTPVQVPAAIPDAGSRMKDSGLGIRDKRAAMRDSKLGALASWVRSERAARGAAEKTDDMYGLLMGLAVPPAVVAVGYGRGCRIRRVRVPVAPEPLSETNGPIILSKRALAEQREQRT